MDKSLTAKIAYVCSNTQIPPKPSIVVNRQICCGSLEPLTNWVHPFASSKMPLTNIRKSWGKIHKTHRSSTAMMVLKRTIQPQTDAMVRMDCSNAWEKENAFGFIVTNKSCVTEGVIKPTSSDESI